MCTIVNLRLLAVLILALKVLLTLYCFAMGIYFITANPILQGLGKEFSVYGASLLIMALLSFAIIVPLYYGMKRHNRFVLIVCVALDVFIATQLLVVSNGIKQYTIPEFPPALELDCLLTTPVTHTPSQCAIYYNSARTAGYRLFWEGYYSNQNNKQLLQVLYDLQDTPCCGFFAPLNCMPNNQSFPNAYSTIGVNNLYTNKVVTCGPSSGYYPASSSCTQYSNPNTNPPTVGGCIYDLGLGSCTQDTTNYIYTTGCASAVGTHLISAILPHVYLILIATIFCLISASMSCCMFLKRKEIDVFPNVYMEHKALAEFKEVKAQFEVEPSPDLLFIRGFLPYSRFSRNGKARATVYTDDDERKDSDLEPTERQKIEEPDSEKSSSALKIGGGNRGLSDGDDNNEDNSRIVEKDGETQV